MSKFKTDTVGQVWGKHFKTNSTSEKDNSEAFIGVVTSVPVTAVTINM